MKDENCTTDDTIAEMGGIMSGLIDREYERVLAQQGDASPKENKSCEILNYFAGVVGTERLRSETLAQKGALEFWRQDEGADRKEIFNKAPDLEEADLVGPHEMLPADLPSVKPALATVYNYRRKKNATYTQLLAMALNQ